jgi:hypothetical protein
MLIECCSKAIFILDELEESRALARPEFNFRKLLVKLHLEDLLAANSKYWRNRCTIRWIKVGEENNKYFHAMASKGSEGILCQI